jgi:hypothetical protein
MKSLRWSRGIAPVMFNLSTTWRKLPLNNCHFTPSTHLHILNEKNIYISHYLILHAKKLRSLYRHNVGRDSIVSIVTRYGLDGPGIESQWGQDFLHPSRPALGPTQPPIQCVPGLFPRGGGVKWPAWLRPLTASSTRLKKE